MWNLSERTIDIESIDTKSDSVHWDLSWSVSWSTRSSATDDLGDYLSVDHPYVLKSTDYLKSEIHIYCTGLFSLVYRIGLGIYAFYIYGSYDQLLLY